MSNTSVTNEGSPRAPRSALLVDCDNTNPAHVEEFAKERLEQGESFHFRYLFGNKGTYQSTHWQAFARAYGARWCGQSSTLTGKNAADIALSLEAISLFYEQGVRWFWLVTSDADFTLLAIKLRELGATVYGVGRPNASSLFVQSCAKFYTLAASTEEEPAPTPSSPKTPEELVQAEVNRLSKTLKNKEGKVHLGELGTALKKAKAPLGKNYHGHKTLTKMLRSMGFQVDQGFMEAPVSKPRTQKKDSCPSGDKAAAAVVSKKAKDTSCEGNKQVPQPKPPESRQLRLL